MLAFPHTYHQNGIVERKHKHIVDMGLTLAHAKIPFQFWDHSFTAVFPIKNRFPSPSLPNVYLLTLLYSRPFLITRLLETLDVASFFSFDIITNINSNLEVLSVRSK